MGTDIAADVARFIARMIIPVCRFLIWSGLWLPVVFSVVSDQIWPDNTTPKVAWFVIWTIWGLLTLKKLLRGITGNHELLSLRTALRGSQRANKAVNPSIPDELLSNIPKGMFFGKKKKKYVCKSADMDGAALVIGGAGSGKSSCIAIPTIKTWKGAIFAIDIKGELAEKGLTAEKHACTKVFNPSKPMSYGYDPFYLLSQSRNYVQDIREIALALIEEPPNQKDPYWIRSAQNIFSGAMVYGYESGNSFIDIVDWLQTNPPDGCIAEICANGSMKAKAFVNQYSSIKTEQLGSIWSEMSNHLLLFAVDDDVRRSFSKKEVVTPADLENGFNIFLQLEENKLEQWRSLLTLMVNQFLKSFERRPEGQAPILMLLDEAPRLGKLRLTEALATLRSRKIHIMTFVQSVAQLDLIYGQDARKVITDNCAYKAILGANDADTREWLSKLVGTYDKLKRSRSVNKQDLSIKGGHSTSVSEEEKRIIKPEEFGQLTDIVLLSPFGFCRIEKAPYYLEKNL